MAAKIPLLTNACGVPLKRALDARGQLIVLEFLTTLITFHDQIGRKKCRVGPFLKAFMLNHHGHYSGHKDKKNPKKYWTKELLDEAIELHTVKGMYWKDIAAAHGKSAGALLCAVNDYKTGRRSYE